jgi:geranylgeranyl diphosphate synthase type II
MNEILQSYSERVDLRLKALLELKGIPDALRDAMRYSVFAGGKRLRPALNLMANRMLDGSEEETIDIACAIEMIHTYSLIHDDLPAMDNDALRRGKPTNHVVFGEAHAILAGDALLNYAFETMLQNALNHARNMKNQLKAIKIVADAAGPKGMIAGQCCDIEFEGKQLSKDELEYVHTHKTGAMITASLLSGAILSSPTNKEIGAVIAYGDRIGLVFQIVDDILDEEGDASKMGKTAGKDKQTEKLTYPKIYGLKESYRLAERLTEEAVASLDVFGDNARELKALASFLLVRNH